MAPTNQTQPVLTDDVRLQMYRTIRISRGLDDLEILLKRQNRVFFQISGAGHEAAGAAAAQHLSGTTDWFFPYYRDRALCLGVGYSPVDMLLEATGAAAAPGSGGRQMPSHWGHTRLNFPSQSSCTGTQFLHAVGAAEAAAIAPSISDGATAAVGARSDEVVYVSAGDGTTSEGEFHEALNTACNLRLPVVFHIQDNGYAISVPVEVQTAGGSISKLLAGYPDLLRIEFNGCDPDASFEAWSRGVAYARARKGPVLMHGHVVRPYSHSMSDDERLYRPKAELEEQAKLDPYTAYRQSLIEQHGIDSSRLDALDQEIEALLEQTKQTALAAPAPRPETATDYVYSPKPETDPTTSAFQTAAALEGEPRTMVDMINGCLHDEMARDECIIVFGEDVADASREEVLKEVKGKGGVFKATANLQRAYGSHRVFNAPIAEANIVGRAIGMALRGLRPVIEIQFLDYIYPAMMQIRNELAPMRWRSNNTWTCPVVIRATYGGYLKGGGVYHSQTGEAIFAHTPGLRVVLPSNALDAAGLLRTAIRCDDPVLFLEHKHLYRQTYNRAAYPGTDFMIPFGQARVARQGSDLTIVTYGALVKRCLDAADQALKHGIQVEVLDLRTVSPIDWDAIATSVKKTGKVMVVYEDCLSWGSGAEVAARIAHDLFDWLDGPVQRVASTDTFVGYHPNLEDAILPQTGDVLSAIEDLAAY